MLEGCVPWPEEFVKLYTQKGYWEDIILGDTSINGSDDTPIVQR